MRNPTLKFSNVQSRDAWRQQIPDDIRRGAEARLHDRQVPAGGRPGPQSGALARHEVGLRQGAAPLLQGLRTVGALRAYR